jgi:hypothetical protein
LNGLHSCKPGNEPVVGQVKTFVVQQMTGKSGKPYTKIKSASVDAGGQPYTITKVSPTGHTDSYGNISFNLDIEPAGAQEGTAPQSPPARQSNGGGTYGGRSPETQERIERQHSQEMALRWFAMIGGIPGDAKDYTAKIRAMTDWFQRDILDDRLRTKHHRTKTDHHYEQRNTSGNSAGGGNAIH